MWDELERELVGVRSQVFGLTVSRPSPERKVIAWSAPAFRAATSVLSSIATDNIASASLSLAFSTAPGRVPKLPAISAHAWSNACPIALMVSGPNEAPSINRRALITTAQLCLETARAWYC